MAESSARGARAPKKQRSGRNPQPATLDLQRLFTTPAQMETFISSFQLRKIVEPRYLDFDFFTSEAFNFVNVLTQLKLKNLATITAPYYPDLVKVFYCNLKYEDNVLSSEVKGIKIVLRYSILEELTGLKYDGDDFDGTNMRHWNSFNRNDAVRSLLREGCPFPTKRIGAGHLSVENRLLHCVLVNTLIPRGTNLAVVTEEDVFVLWAMNTRLSINWPFYITQHMLKARRRTHAPLPYAMFITKILMKFKVFVAGEAALPELPSHIINEKYLKRMKIKKINGHWIRIGDDESESDDEPMDEHMANEDNPVEQPQPPQQPPPDYSHAIGELLDGFHWMKGFMQTTAQEMHSRMNTMDGRFDHIDSQLVDITARLRALESGHDADADDDGDGT